MGADEGGSVPREELERRVRERTAELERLNAMLTAEVHDREQVEATLRASEERFRIALRSGPFTVFNQDLDLRYTWISNPQMGMRSTDVVGKCDAELFPTVTAQELERIKRQVLRTGVGAATEVHWDVNGETRFFEFRAEPLRDDDGTITGITGAKLDVTDRKRAERHRAFLLAELDHRVKNNLSVVLALAEESVRTAGTMQEFSRAFIGRVRALAKTHAALAASQWEGVGLADLVRLTMDSYGTGNARRLDVEGERVHLSPKAASALCMAVHELMTNAAKHGAFSTAAGTVSLRWRVGAGGASGGGGGVGGVGGTSVQVCRVLWQETGGPAVSPPVRRGLGTQLIEDGVAYELGGAVRTEYAPEGVRCTIEFPLNETNTQRGRFEREVSAKIREEA